MRTLVSSLAFLFLFAGALQAQTITGGIIAEPPEGSVPWTNLEFNNDPERFQFAIVTDRTGGHRPGVFMEGVKRLNLVQPEFVMSVGDLIEGYTEDTVELRRQWEEFDGFVDQLDMPFFYLPGNHDITNAVMEQVWKDRYGPTYYSFTYRGVLFMALNSEDQYRGSGRGSISDAQYEWIKSTLEDHPDAEWTLLFMHQPLWLQGTDPVRWADVESLLADRKHTVFVGHRHHYTKYERNNGKYFLLATTGGGSALRGAELGEFDHVVWVTMTEQGPLIANLELSGVWNEDVVTEQTQAYIDKVDGRDPIQVEPFFVEDGGFTGGTTRLRITNDEDVPMRLVLNDKFSWDLQAGLSDTELEIGPNSVEFVDLDLAPRRPENARGPWEPVTVEGYFQYLDEDAPKLEFPFRFQFRPEQKYRLSRISGPVTVDGDLSEWSDLPVALSESGDPNDASLHFDLRYDDENLYFAARVRDEDIQDDPEDNLNRQDFLGLVLNAGPLQESAYMTSRGNYEGSVIFFVSPHMAQYQDRLPEGTRWSCQAEPGGYIVEMSFPLSYIREKQGNDWKTLRMNVVLHDKDEGEEASHYFFQPEWGSSTNRRGSGTFFREDAGE